MRWPMAILCCGLAGCSSFEGAIEPVKPPEPAAIKAAVKVAAMDAKLPDPLEISTAFEAATVAPGPWEVCMKSAAPAQNLRYAVFFKNNVPVAARLAVRGDRCGEATFAPLPP